MTLITTWLKCVVMLSKLKMVIRPVAQSVLIESLFGDVAICSFPV